MTKLKKMLIGLAVASGIAVLAANTLPYNSLARGLIGQRSVSENEVTACQLKESGDRYAVHCYDYSESGEKGNCEYTHDVFSDPSSHKYTFYTPDICSNSVSKVCIDDECKTPESGEAVTIAVEGRDKICYELNCNEMCARQQHLRGTTPEDVFFRNVDDAQR